MNPITTSTRSIVYNLEKYLNKKSIKFNKCIVNNKEIYKFAILFDKIYSKFNINGFNTFPYGLVLALQIYPNYLNNCTCIAFSLQSASTQDLSTAASFVPDCYLSNNHWTMVYHLKYIKLLIDALYACDLNKYVTLSDKFVKLEKRVFNLKSDF